MNQNELWAAYVARNPDFDKPDAQITMTARGLKKLFDQTWNVAHKEGIEAEKLCSYTEQQLDNLANVLRKSKLKKSELPESLQHLFPKSP